MPSIPKLFRILSLSRIFGRKKSRLVIVKMEGGSEASSERQIPEEVVPEAPIERSTPKEPISEAPTDKSVLKDALPGSSAGKFNLRKHVSESNLKRYCSECGIQTPHPAKCLLGALIVRSISKVSTTRPIPQEITRPIPQETVPEVPVQIHIPKVLLPQASIRSEPSTPVARTRQPRATAQNSRLLALPVELRIQIYDALLAIPRTVHILEPAKWAKSNIHRVRKFDKQLFSRRACSRYKFSAPCAGYFDPRTTTFAVRFVDDESCVHRAWDSDVFTPGHGVPTTMAQVTAPADMTDRPDGGYLIFARCSATAQNANKLIWNQMLEQLRLRPEIQIVEFEFHKLCSMITVIKFLLLGHWEGWRELRNLKFLKIRLRIGNGGPLNIWEMMILVCLAMDVNAEMKRKVLLRRGPRIQLRW